MNKNGNKINIRLEEKDDQDAIYTIHAVAFNTDGEARIVNTLRENCNPFISLVADVSGQVVGHVLFTPVQLLTEKGRTLEGMGLAPLAVLPEYQHRGIGSALCEVGLASMKNLGITYVVVLGHPDYYPRFGFEPAVDLGIRCAYRDVPPKAFMIKIFDDKALDGVTGIVKYRPEFDEVT
jgi:putative acetyltransferase